MTSVRQPGSGSSSKYALLAVRFGPALVPPASRAAADAAPDALPGARGL